MSTTTIGDTRTSRQERRYVRASRTRIEVGRVGLGTVGVVTVLISAWGGIIPYVGPVFGYSADGTGSWYWNLSHAVLGLVPGALAFVMGILMVRETREVIVGRGRISVAMAGFITVLCGAWFIVGPLAWPVITDHGAYFVTTVSPLRNLANQLGYSLGTGVILAACGAFAMGWAARHQVSSAVGAAPLVRPVEPSYSAEPAYSAEPSVPAYSAEPTQSPLP